MMKKIIILWIAVLVTCMASAQVSTWDGTWQPWTHGTGTEADPFLIENAQQLAYLAYRVNNGLDANGGHVSNHDYHYKLMVDVDLNGSESFQWTPIGYGNSDTDYQCFGGQFDGNNHTVSGLYINSSANGMGFFARTEGATIKNLSVNGTKVSTSSLTAGGVVGVANSTVIMNCSTDFTDGVSTSHCAGGIVGVSVSTSTITNCHNIGNVSASAYSGGILGLGTATLTNCYNTGIVSGAYYYSGGIVGYAEATTIATTSITNCYNTGTVSGSSYYSGGIVGYAATATTDTITITNCYNTGTISGISGSSYPGGVLGYANTAIIITNCYNTGTVSGSFPGGIVGLKNNGTVINSYYLNTCGGNNTYGGQSMSSDAMQTQEFVDLLNNGYCVWEYDYINTNSGFPVLTWQNQDTIYIYDAEMLHTVAEQCNSGVTFEGKYVKLMNDIELPHNVPNNMISIGSYPDHPFKGTFDGNGKLITNLYIDQPNTPYQGFFGYTLNANLYNVGLVNITASGRNYTGGMVAYAKNTYMRDCYVNGGTLFALSYCGGLVGYQEQGTNSIISGCYNTCEVTGNNYVGGLIGFSNYSTVRNSYVAGRVSAQGEPVGAIIGGANEVLMYHCYFSTELTGQTNAIGWNNFKDGGEGLTNAQMRDPQFVNTLNQNLVTPVWMADYATHINNGFPIINWQRPGTGVEEHDAAKQFVSIYPNPANGFVTIQSDDSNVSLQQVEIYDVMGRKVMSEPLDGQRQELGIDKLLSGLYQVCVQTSNGCYANLKLIVQ